MISRRLTIGWERILIIIFVIWVVSFVFIYPRLLTPFDLSNNRKVSARLSKAFAEIEALRVQNQELLEVLKGINYLDMNGDEKQSLENFQERLLKISGAKYDTDSLLVPQKEEPSLQYEVIRRQIETNIKEFWYYINAELKKLPSKGKDAIRLPDRINDILKLAKEHEGLLLHYMEKLSQVDGYENWRDKEANELSKIVQDRFHYLQNPTDCKTAKKLKCNLNKGCGYGCQLHNVVYCFIVAYGTERTLVMESKGWRYHKDGWEDIFKPLSETCTDGTGDTISKWPGTPEIQVLTLPIIDSLNPKPSFLPLAIPEDLAPRLIRLHGDPSVWWIGQVLKYLIRPQQKTADVFQKAITNLGFQRPIVGVHIRRTDKIYSEAAFHSLEEYMTEVEAYYDRLDLTEKVTKRRIYLASDDPKVFPEARKKYPNYEILGDADISKTAAVSTRYTDKSLQGVLLDIHMLSMSDFLVCTFSSQVCRVAYEIMQTFYPDASARFRSLDDIYYFGGQLARELIAVVPHEAKTPDEIDILPGDVIGMAGNHWDGFSKGSNRRTQQIGLFPAFKTKTEVRTAAFPKYADIQNGQNQEQT